MTLTRDEQLVRDNLWLNLRDIALKWWTDELYDVERRMIRMIMIEQKELSEWINLLHNRFKQFINVVMNSLMQQRYTLRNVAVQRESREYAQKIIRLIKNVDMINVLNQLNFIYNDIDVDVRVDTLRRSKNNIIINEMLNDMNEFKHDWWIKVVKFRNNIDDQNNNNRNQLSRQDARSQQFDQYNNSNRQSQSQRQSSQFQSFQRQSFQSRYSNNAYQNQYSQQSRQSYQQAKYQNYKSADYQIDYSNNQENQYSNARTLSTSSNRLQIIVDSTNVNASNSNQQQFMSSRQSFKSLNNNQRDDYDKYAQRSQTTYQASVFDEANENNYINETNDAHWLSEYHDIDDSVLSYEESDLFDDYNQNVEIAQNVNFLTFVTEINTDTHNCSHCNSIFVSRNQLFKHLRNACWFSDTSEHVDHAISVIKLSSIVLISQRNSNAKTSHEKIYELSHVFSSVNRRVIQFIVRSDETNSDYAFREYQYDQVTVRLDNNIESIKICIDIDCSVIMIDRKFLTQLLSNVFVQKLASSIFMRDVSDKIVKSDEFMLVSMTFDEVLKSKHAIIDVIEVEMHLIDDFAINMLLANDVIYSQDIKIDFEKRRLTIIKCESLRVSIEVLNRITSHIKRTIRFRQTYILQSDDFTKILVTYHDSLSDDRDFLFEFHCQYDLEYDDDVYAHIVNNNLFKMLVRNVTSQSITLAKRARLDMSTEYNQTECYLIMSEKSYKTVNDWMNERSWKKQLIVSFVTFAVAYVILDIASHASHESTTSLNESIVLVVSIVSQINSTLKHVLSSDVTMYEAKMFELINLVNMLEVCELACRLWDEDLSDDCQWRDLKWRRVCRWKTSHLSS